MPALALLLLSFPLLMALLLVPFWLQRSVFPPADALLAGPLEGGAIHIAAVAVAVVCLAVFRHAAARIAGRGGDGAPARRLASGLLCCCAAAYAYGTGTYWYVTPRAVAVRDDLFGPARLHPWSDVTGREIGCWMSKGGGPNASYVIRLRGDRPLDIAGTQETRFEARFGEVAALTEAAPVAGPVRGLSSCPAYMERYLAGRPDIR